MRNKALVFLAISFFVAVLGFTPRLSHADELSFPAQALSESLRALGNQTKTNMLFDPVVTAKVNAPAVSKAGGVEEALKKLLVGSGLTFRFVDPRTVTVIPEDRSGKEDVGKGSVGATAVGNLRLARVGGTTDSSAANGEQQGAPKEEEGKEEGVQLEEVVVTGTHIRGVKVGASQVQMLTRKDIARSGLTSTIEVLRRVSANFGGGIATETARSGVLTQHSGDNRGYASSPNLRGLGSDATLVLLNGHRLPQASQGFSVDISLIPLSIVERIEVLKDGASAIYGSDAVAGVINIITKQSFDSAESVIVAGGVTSGDKDDIQISQLLGHNWGSGSASISYTYDNQDSLSTIAREFSHTAPQPSVLSPKIKSQSAYAVINQHVSSAFEVGADALVTRKSIADDGAVDAGGFDALVRTSADIRSFVGTLTPKFNVGRDWQLTLPVLFAKDETEADLPESALAGVIAAHTINNGRVYSIEPHLDGRILSLPGGWVRAAVGGSFRSEAFNQSTLDNLLEFDLERDIAAGYAEFFVPLVSQVNRQTALERLEITASVRYENYSDFGSTTNPKFGLLWSPVPSIALRSTYGTSFRAPQLAERQQGDALDILLLLPDPLSPTNESLTIYRIGGNPDLQPQTANSWNFGLTFDPSQLQGFHSEVTYFDIRFKDRIQQPGDGAVFIQAAPDLYGKFLTRDPSTDLVNSLVSGVAFENAFGDFNPEDVDLIADARRTNLSKLDVSGIDFGLRFGSEIGSNAVEFTVDASYLLRYTEILAADQPPVARRNSPYYPASLRARAGVSVAFPGPWSAAAYFNYVGSYSDTRVAEAPLDIEAWPTLDAQLSYTTEKDGSAWSGMSVSVTAINLFNREPPVVVNPNPRFTTGCCQNYDATNASPLQRYMSLRVAKSW